MALLEMEGFEGAGTTDDEMRWYLRKMYPSDLDFSANTYNIAGRYSGRALKGSSWAFVTMPFTAAQTVIVGFAFWTQHWNSDKWVITLKDDLTYQMTVETVAGGDLRVLRNTTTLGTTVGLGGAIGTWYYIEFKVTIDNGTAGSYELRVNGVNVLSNSACDTQESANATVNHVGIIMDEGDVRAYDDIYICDDSGSINNDFLGDMQVVMLSPDADGDDSDFTASGANHYEDIDDGTTPDYDSTYLAGVTSDKELFYFEDLTVFTTIAGVKMYTDARKTDAPKQILKLISKSSLIESAGNGLSLPLDYLMHYRITETDPSGNAWTQSTLNTNQFGFELV